MKHSANNALKCCGSLVLYLFSGQMWLLGLEVSWRKRNLSYKIPMDMIQITEYAFINIAHYLWQ